MELKKLISSSWALPFCLVLVSYHAFGSKCANIEAEWLKLNGRVISNHSTDVFDTFVITSSNSHLKSFNSEVFKEWTRGSEYLTNVLHFFFQFHLNNRLGSQNVDAITERRSPWVKNLEITIKSSSLPKEMLESVVIKSRRQAIESAADYIFRGDLKTRQLVEDISNPFGQLSKSNHFIFAENRDHLMALSTGDRSNFQRHMETYFATEQQFLELLNKKYNVGIGKSIFDSHFAAKLASARPNGGVVTFEVGVFKKVLMGAKNQMEALKPLFTGKSDAQIEEIFRLLRGGIEKKISLWSKSLRQLALENANTSFATQELQLRDFQRRLRVFMKTINFLDYLPEDYSKTDVFAAKRMEQIKDPDLVMFLDVKGLGAKNYNTLMKAVEPLLSDVTKLESLFEQMAQSKNEEFQIKTENEATKLLNQIILKRKYILAESNNFLIDIKNRLLNSLLSSGLRRDQFELWTSGDDMYMVANTKHAGISPSEVIKRINNEPLVLNNTRMAYWLPGKSRVTLDEARLTLSGSVNILKAIEALHIGYKATTAIKNEMYDSETMNIWRIDELGAIQTIPMEHQPILKDLSTGWDVLF